MLVYRSIIKKSSVFQRGLLAAFDGTCGMIIGTTGTAGAIFVGSSGFGAGGRGAGGRGVDTGGRDGIKIGTRPGMIIA